MLYEGIHDCFLRHTLLVSEYQCLDEFNDFIGGGRTFVCSPRRVEATLAGVAVTALLVTFANQRNAGSLGNAETSSRDLKG